MSEREPTENEKKLARYWNRQLQLGKEYQKKYGLTEDWKKYKEMYRGHWDEKIVPVNKVFSIGRSMIPRTYFRDPSVTVTARRPEFEWHARVVEAIDTWLIAELKLKKQLKRSILDAYTCGTACIKLGYDSEFGYFSQQAVAHDGVTATRFGQSDGELIEYNTGIKTGMPWALRTPPSDVITPWGYADAEDFPWVAHEYIRPLEDVKQDQKYRNTKDLKGGIVLDRSNRPQISVITKLDESEVYCKITEIRDFKRRMITILAEDKILASAPDELIKLAGSPFEFVIPNPDPDYFWGISDVRIIAEQQKELNDQRTQASKHRRLAKLRFLYKKGIMKKENLEKFLSEEDTGLGIECEEAENLQTDIIMFQPHIPPDLYRESIVTEHNMDEAVGYSRNYGGEFKPGTPPTAEEVSKVAQGYEIRGDERRDIYADTLVNVVKKWNQYIFKFWDGPRLARVIGPDGAAQWIQFTGSELLEGTAEYAYKIDPDSNMPVSKALRYEQGQKLFEMLNGDPFTDQVMLRKMLLRQYEWIDPAWQMMIRMPGPMPPELLAQTGGVPKGTMPTPDGKFLPLSALKPQGGKK